jgi:tetratricopeptide (TPR) repeat protein
MELNAHQFALLNQWFEQAVDLPPPERDAFVAKVRAEHGDQLAEELIRLFTAGDEPTGTMNYAPPQSIAQPAAFHAGETILDRFRIVRALGRGGMGEVYEAQDRELGPVALKTIRRDLLGDPGVLRRFKQEVQLARQVTSPHVCRIHEFFTLPDDGQHRPGAFLTMELVEGETLAQRIRHAPLAWSEAEPIVMELCQGLQALHSLGLVHRDFKPANTMLARRGKLTQAVVMDLGLALRPDESATGHGKLTMTGGIVGTPGYMAPEQFEGSQVSPATDIYALGLVMYEMTTGRRPFEASTPLAAAVRRARRPPPVSSIRPGLPRRLDLVIAKCLEFDPADRFASADAVAKALRGDTSELPAIGSRRRRRALALLAIVALALFLAAGFILRTRMQKESPGSSAEATRWYKQGTAALREGTYLKATNALERAVNLDKNFVLAHVRLADAWNELDFSGRAKDEMLQASAFESNGTLSAVDKKYVEAVRHTLVRDFPAALRDYQNILAGLPRETKGDGYVDLGRAYEKAGDTQQAISAYSTAAKLDPEYPASFVRLAVLEDRRKHTAAADAAYAKAGSLYRAASNLEGLAEIDLQRGNNANTQLRLDEARTDLNRSLQAAKDIPSLQLEIRALTRLSVTEYLAHNTGDSIRLANQAVAMAEENGLEYWAIDGVTRLGNAYISSENYDKAGKSFEQALSLAQKSQRPRLIALAELGLAQVRESQNQPNVALPIAKAALAYYRGNGFKSESGEALTLLLRAQRDIGDNNAALQSSRELLALAAELDDPAVRMRAEESAGAVLFNLERYPEALDHVQKALTASRVLNQQVEYHLLDYADTVWRLGEYDEARQSLAGIPAGSRSRPDIRLRINETTAAMFLSQKQYAEAKNVVQKALADKFDDDPAFFYRLRGQVETAFSMPKQAREWCRKALDQATKDGDRLTIAASQLALANAYLAGRLAADAEPLAQAAHDFFAGSGQRESQYLALLTLAKIARATQDTVKSKTLAQQGMDILASLEHNYSPQQYQAYLSRADIRDARAQLVALAK